MKSIFIVCFLFVACTFEASATLIKSTYVIDNVRGSYNPNSFCYCRYDLPDIPTSLSWSVIYQQTQNSIFTVYDDGANGIAEFGKGDDTIAYADDITNLVSPGDYFTDAIVDISQFKNFAEASVSRLFDKTLRDYDNTDQHSSGSGYFDGEVYTWVQADAYQFVVQSGRASFQLGNSCASGGQQCIFGNTLSFGGNIRLVSSEVINQVSTPVTSGLLLVSLLIVMHNRHFRKKLF